MSGEQETPVWPIPKFYFKVTFGNTQMKFLEVSGLDVEEQVIEYRHGESSPFSTIKMPGIQKTGNVTMKKGVIEGGKPSDFYDWYSKIQLNIIERITVVISLLDQEGNSTMTWTLNNAWPTKVSGADMNAEGNEVAVETIEIAYESLVVKN